MKSYGLPYMGSKSAIAEWVVSCLPPGRRLVDLFAGGCAVAHCAALSGRYAEVLMNDVTDAPRLFIDAVRGRYRGERRWISREDFSRLKDTDPYVRLCWSFGNNQRDYLYGRTIEPYKRALHMAVLCADFSELRRLCPEVAPQAEASLAGLTGTRGRRLAIGRAIVARLNELGSAAPVERNPLYASCRRSKSGGNPVRNIQSLQSLQRLQRLQSLESLERLQSLESLERKQIKLQIKQTR